MRRLAEGRRVQQMIDTQTLLDSGMVYFGARLSEHYPTIGRPALGIPAPRPPHGRHHRRRNHHHRLT